MWKLSFPIFWAICHMFVTFHWLLACQTFWLTFFFWNCHFWLTAEWHTGSCWHETKTFLLFKMIFKPCLATTCYIIIINYLELRGGHHWPQCIFDGPVLVAPQIWVAFAAWHSLVVGTFLSKDFVNLIMRLCLLLTASHSQIIHPHTLKRNYCRIQYYEMMQSNTFSNNLPNLGLTLTSLTVPSPFLNFGYTTFIWKVPSFFIFTSRLKLLLKWMDAKMCLKQ